MGEIGSARSHLRFAVDFAILVLAIALIAVPELRNGRIEMLVFLLVSVNFAFMLRDLHRAKLLNLTITQLYRTRGKPMGSAVGFVGLWLAIIGVSLPAPH